MAQCLADGCDRKIKARGMCGTHYHRWWRGSPVGSPIRHGKPTGVPCEVEACEGLAVGRGMCSKHYARVYRHGDPDVVLSTGRPVGHWLVEIPKSRGAHYRVRQLRGTPKSCEHCGLDDEDKRYHWALKPEARDAAIPSPNGPYSLDANDYVRLCVPCHKAMDLKALGSERIGI